MALKNTTTLEGKNFIGADLSAEGSQTLQAVDPSTGTQLEPEFYEATSSEVDRALETATEAFSANRSKPADEHARLLELVADEIETLGEELVQRTHAETGLGEDRVRGERGRTTGQLRMFAEVVREGSWVDARIDLPPRQDAASTPDLRRTLLPIGPAAVFGASNFPLAFSVAGGDTASALAAGCPVIVKAHPAHPGTSELVAGAIRTAVQSAGFHDGTFSMLHGKRPEVSIKLVCHPQTRAVGFTGSLKAGRAIFDAAAARPRPIPVHAEMGSVNPVFMLPGALAERPEELAEGLIQSVTLGTGQFCTNPGLVFGLKGDSLERFAQATAQGVADVPTSAMLHDGIRESYKNGVRDFQDVGGVQVVGRAEARSNNGASLAGAVVLSTDSETFLKTPRLKEEVFGPSSLVVQSTSKDHLLQIARELEGNLTATLHGTDEDLADYRDLVRILEDKVGRLIFNGFPTGVEVCASMHHGGPYPATSDARFTSVGTAAIERFARPICYQDFPQAALPSELRDRNERGIWRLVNDTRTRDDI